MNNIDELAGLLNELLALLDGRENSEKPAWQLNARATIRQNISSYLDGLHKATGPASITDAVCRVSGIRKGIADLGLFRPGDRIMEIADRADALATGLCRAGRTP